MFGQAQQRYLNVEDYFEAELVAEARSEYCNGQAFAMAGASEPHEDVAANLVMTLRQQTRGRACKAYGSGLKLWIPTKKSSRYPDVSVVCGQIEFYQAERPEAILNPTVIIEVLSPSTEATDRGAKAEEYRSLPSLQEYLFVAQDRYHVEHYVRHGAQQWLMTEYNELDAIIRLASVECQLALADVYYQLVFPALTDEPAAEAEA